MAGGLRVSALLALLLAAPAVASAETRLLPVDQAITVPGFFSFRAQLQTAVARHDVQAVVSVLSKDVKLSFGGDAGVEDFRRIWKPETPDSRLWETLAEVLSLGGRFAPDGTFSAPYVYTEWPEDRDAFDHMAVIGSAVRVRGSPSADAPVVAVLDYSIVEVAEAPAADSGWIQVAFAPGRTGFVDARFLRSPIDYRVSFARLEGRWQIVSFVAGD